LAMSLNNIASIYYAQEKYREAFDLFEDVFGDASESPSSKSSRLGKSYNNLPRCIVSRAAEKKRCLFMSRAVTIAEIRLDRITLRRNSIDQI